MIEKTIFILLSYYPNNCLCKYLPHVVVKVCPSYCFFCHYSRDISQLNASVIAE